MISTNDIYWAAGIMEGEGWFGCSKKDGVEKGLKAELTMVDKDVIDRFASIFNFGTRKTRALPSGKIAYSWSTTHQSNTAGFMMTLFPLMGARRQEKILQCLDTWMLRPLPKRQWTHCKNGHELSGANLRITYEGKYKKRRCNECSRLRTQKHRSKIRFNIGLNNA